MSALSQNSKAVNDGSNSNSKNLKDMKSSTTNSTQSNNSITAIVIIMAVILLVVGLLVMDIHLSYKHYGQHITHSNIFLNFTIKNDNVNISSNPISNTNVNIETKKLSTIAYIFAGAARSLTCPEVHWSIKAHLIDALGGEPHVFVRLSYEDNKNVKTGSGIIIKPNYDLHAIQESLKLLNPEIVESFQLSTQIEEMKKYFPAPIHTVFRENDNRRYSMFYHRCRAYRLMLQYEAEHNMKFDWVVLARLDAHWLEPILPIDAYYKDRVWITETGYDRFNDQFMIIPRQYSDYLYDLNTKATKEVYCLGGPDVEQWKCNRTELLIRGVTEEKIESVLPYCCKDILKTKHNVLGRSERIHYRHLEEGKIPISLGRFPVALTRLYNGQCETECFRIYAYHYKEYIYRFTYSVYKYLMPHLWPATSGKSISARDRQLCYVQKENIYPWKPISALKLHSLSSEYKLDYSKKLIDQLDHVHPSILRNPKDTELWRIHPTWNTEGCLKFSYQTKLLSWEMCKGHSWGNTLNYDATQLFFLYVIPARRKADAVILHHSYQSSHWFPDSTYNTNVAKITRLMTLNTRPEEKGYISGALCLTASELKPKAIIKMQLCTENNKFQNLITVHTQMDGSHPLTTIGKLQFAAAPHLCVSRADNKKIIDSNGNQLIFPESNDLFVFQCNWGAQLHQNTFEFELVLS